MGELLAIGPERHELQQRGVAAGEHHRDAAHAQAQLAGIGEAQRAAGGWCRRCRALTVEAESGRCLQCGGGLAAGYEWVEAE